MPQLTPLDPFAIWEFYAFRGALFVIFVCGLYRFVRRDPEMIRQSRLKQELQRELDLA